MKKKKKKRIDMLEPILCDGEWIAGSGGHRVHSSICENIATWFVPDLYHYCSEHLNRFDEDAEPFDQEIIDLK